MADQNFPSPSSEFRGNRQKAPANLFDAASRWNIKGLNIPFAATLALYAGRVVDRLTGKAYSADELRGSPDLVIVTDATAYVLSPTDNGKTIYFTSSTAVTVTVPAGLGKGFNVTAFQGGDGILGFIGSGVTITSHGGFSETESPHTSARLLAWADNTFNLSFSVLPTP